MDTSTTRAVILLGCTRDALGAASFAAGEHDVTKLLENLNAAVAHCKQAAELLPEGVLTKRVTGLRNQLADVQVADHGRTPCAVVESLTEPVADLFSAAVGVAAAARVLNLTTV